SVKQLSHLRAERVCDCRGIRIRPRLAILGYENDASVCIVFRPRAPFKSFPYCRNRLRPKWTAPFYTCLRSGKFDPTAPKVQSCQGKPSTIAVSETTVDSQQNHCADLRPCGCQDSQNLIARKHLLAFSGAGQAQRLLIGFLESRSKTNWLVHENAFIAVFE